jgi:hypothetical protein
MRTKNNENKYSANATLSNYIIFWSIRLEYSYEHSIEFSVSIKTECLD